MTEIVKNKIDTISTRFLKRIVYGTDEKKEEHDGKAIAKMITYFYDYGAISEKSDADLEKLMSGLSAN